MTAEKIRVAVVGTGRWAQVAHIPGWQRDPRAEVVALADADEAALAATASRFSVARTATDYRDLLGDPGIDVVDVVTGNRPHFEVSWDALSAGKHVLCEKPVHNDYRKTREAARARGVPRAADQARVHVPLRPRRPLRQGADRLGLRRRALHLQRLRAEQPVDRPGHAAAPVRRRPRRRPGADRGVLDRGLRRADHRHHALVARPAAHRGGGRHAQLRPRADGPRHREDDPRQHRRRRHVDRRVRRRDAGLDPVVLRDRRQLPGHRGAHLRLGGRGDRRGWWTSSASARRSGSARKDAVEFVEAQIPERFFPPGGHSGEPWEYLFYSNLVSDFIDEILDGGRVSQGDFAQGALVQETINAFEASFRQRAWVDFPLGAAGEADRP